MAAAADLASADLERRFGGLRRLYGDAGYARLRAARVAVVGVGGVGSWAVEALARSGVGRMYASVTEAHARRIDFSPHPAQAPSPETSAS